MKKKIYFILIFQFFVINCFSQIDGQFIHDSINSKIYNQSREYYVYLPDNYSNDSLQKYSVGYVFDSQFPPYLTMTSSIMSYYSQTESTEPLILVGIVSEDRQEEFIPDSEESAVNNTLKGPKRLTQFIKEEIFPLIDEKYRTNSFKIGIGHSLGGTYLIDNLFDKDCIFDAVIAASPNLVFDSEYITKKINDAFEKHPNINKYLYVNVGDKGKMEQAFKNGVLHLDSIILTHDDSSFIWNMNVINDKNHMETFIPTFEDGYKNLSSYFHISFEELNLLVEKTKDSNDFIAKLKDIYAQNELITNGVSELNQKEILKIQRDLGRLNRHDLALLLCTLGLKLSGDNQSENSLIRISKYHQTYVLCIEAEKLGKEEKYKEAADLYEDAFALNSIQGTHLLRLRSIPILAQAKAMELAFEQLELLSNKYKLGGNSSLINDPLCESLHKDKRWKKYMQILKENENLYR